LSPRLEPPSPSPRLAPLKGIPIQTIIAGAIATHSVAISKTGVAYIWGRNEDGQLGLGDPRNRYNPTPLTLPGGGAAIKGAACGAGHTLVWTTEGDLWAFGRNGFGQLGNDSQSEMVTSPIPVKGVGKVADAGVGRDFSVAVTEEGEVYTWGCPEYGQLGNGTNGEVLERAGKVTFNNVLAPAKMSFGREPPKVMQLAVGQHHTIAMDAEGKVWTWGFGGYGRCGHRDNVDCMRPRAVETFSAEPTPYQEMCGVEPNRALRVAAGAACCYVVTHVNALYFWGIAKRTGEAAMYPRLVDDVQGWNIRSVSSGFSSTLIAGEKSLISFGPSPTWGELGYGPDGPKSSTRAEKVHSLEGNFVLALASGYGHSLAIIDTETDAWDEEDVEVLELEECAAGAGGGGGAGAKRKAEAGGAAKGKKAKGEK